MLPPAPLRYIWLLFRHATMLIISPLFDAAAALNTFTAIYADAAALIALLR